MTQVLKLNFLYLSTGQDPESLRDVLLRHIVAGKAVRFRLESFDYPLQKLSKNSPKWKVRIGAGSENHDTAGGGSIGTSRSLDDIYRF